MAIKFANPKEYLAELIGTMVLVATGTIIGSVFGTGLTTAFGFAITFVALIYIAGKVCNCHFNPLITLGMLINKRMGAKDALFCILAQIIGGLLGGLFALFMMTQEFGNADVVLYVSTFGADYTGASWLFGRAFEVCGAFILEFLFAFVLVSVVLRATESGRIDLKSGAIVSLALFALIWFGSEMTYTAVNPADSIGAAFAMMFSDIGDVKFEPIKQLWLFILAPVLGAAVGSVAYIIFNGGDVDIAKYAAAIKSVKPVKKEKPAEGSEEEVSEEPAEEEVSEESVEESEEDEIPEIEPEESEEAPAEAETVSEEKQE